MNIPSTYYRLSSLFAIFSFFFITLFCCLYYYTFQKEDEVYQSANIQFENEVNSLLVLNAQATTSLIKEISYWDELTDFIVSKDEKWFDESVGSLDDYNVDHLAVYNIKEDLIISKSNSCIKTKDFLPSLFFTKLYKQRFNSCYYKIPEGIIHVFGCTIHPTNDSKKITNPKGYFIMVRFLDKKYFKTLEKINNSKINLASAIKISRNKKNYIYVDMPLKDFNNKLIDTLEFKRPIVQGFLTIQNILILILFTFILFQIINIKFSRKWLLEPLKLITKVLETGNETDLATLKNIKGEFGYLGSLYDENNKQKLQLVKAKLQAEESDRLKSSFLTNLSHEIRTPMNAIIGFAELLKSDQLSTTDKNEYINIINKSGEHLILIIDDLIEMSKIDSNQVEPKEVGFDLNSCINELYETIKIGIPATKKIDFYVIENKNPLEKNIITDKIKFKQILTNLINNAIKYTEKGEVSFGYEVFQDRLKLSIIDTGFGIDEKSLKHIFDRFRRIENDLSIISGGLGLGLAISKAYVEMLGGEIFVESKLNQGSTFTFTIPLKYQSSSVEKIVPPLKIKSLFKQKLTILIAEDDDINFLLLKKIMQNSNSTITRAVNGKEAVSLFEKENSFDVVLMDIKMPIMGGIEAAKYIKQINPKIPIIAQTAFSDPDEENRLYGYGFDGYISKPINKEKLIHLINVVIDRTHNSQSLN